MALTSARQILNKKILGGGSSADVQELKVEVAALSASVLTIGEKVENIADYSTDEKIVGKWIDGTDVYEKTINFGALPNASSKQVNHSIENIDTIWIHGGFANNSTSGFTNSLNLSGTDAITNQFYFGVNKTYVQCTANSDRSAYDNCYVILRYTKTAAESKKKTTKKK